MTLADLPSLNASLNAAAGFCLLGGWRAIKRGRNRAVHMRWMVTALVFSTLFLTSYLYYHTHSEPTRYTGAGFMRLAYFAILITHIPLAILVVPFSLAAVYQAWRGRFDRHVRIVRWLWPVWMYVSVTGVLIYLMLYVL
jgi:uncharacterized membrane protein YozB (DUF420 family)